MSALQVPNTTAVLHSDADNVLLSVFGLGQTVAGDGWFPEAVGLRGNPTEAGWSQATRMLAFDHGDYWAELEAAETVCKLIGITIQPDASGVPLAKRKLLARHRGIQGFPLPVYWHR